MAFASGIYLRYSYCNQDLGSGSSSSLSILDSLDEIETSCGYGLLI
jgi:hypothetical protein